LDALARTPSVTVAAQAAGVDRRTVYRHRDADPAFKEAWNDALDQTLDALEHAVYERAIKEDAQLAMFILRSHRPLIYQEKQRLDIGLLGGIVLLPGKKADGGP
jgi:hypothetical protein